jgi:hypothetical protein
MLKMFRITFIQFVFNLVFNLPLCQLIVVVLIYVCLQREITNYNAHTLEGWNNINILRYFIFKVKNLNMLGSKTLEPAHGLSHTQIVTHF